MFTNEDLSTMQAWPLERKIKVTQTRIIDWYLHYGGKVYVSFSGGKDSTALLDLARRIYPDIEAVFCDTGLEYPELREFVKAIENVVWIRPDVPFNQVINTCGYPIISKDVSNCIRGAREGWKSRLKKLTQKTGSKFDKTQWAFLLDAPFKISEQCCDKTKKEPFKKYEKETGRMMITAEMACDSQMRETQYRKNGCNAFKLDRPKSTPMGFWTEQDVLQYLKRFNVPYASIYGDIVATDADGLDYDDILGVCKLRTTGVQRTGCMFCMFGVHLEKCPNRFQQMALTHPKQYNYCINKLGIGKVLDYINVPYVPIDNRPS